MALLETVVSSLATILGTTGFVAVLLNWRTTKLSEQRLREIEDSKQFAQLIDIANG